MRDSIPILCSHIYSIHLKFAKPAAREIAPLLGENIV